MVLSVPLLLSALALASAGEAEPPPSANAASHKAPPQLRLAVYDLAVQGVDPRVGRIVSESVVTELRKMRGLLVVSMEEVRAMLALESDKQLSGCGDDSCLAEIGDALGVDGLVVGQLLDLDGSSVFVLRRIDQRNAKVVGSVQKRLDAADGEEFLAAVGPAVAELFPEYTLRKGQTRGVDPQVALLVNPPPLQPWLFWTTFGTSVATGVASGTLGALAVAARVSLGNLIQSARGGDPISGSDVVSRQNTIAALGWSAVGAGAFALLGGGVSLALYPMTDFAGAAKAGELE